MPPSRSHSSMLANSPMGRVDAAWLSEYLKDDVVDVKLSACTMSGDETLGCQRWLRDSAPKRAIFWKLYGDLIDRSGLRVLDVGGGMTSFTRLLSERHDYTLVELNAHDNQDGVSGFVHSAPKLQLQALDWWQMGQNGRFDVVIANDLFPNVDQRLELFLERYIPVSKHIRLSLTYYDNPRFYMTRRVDADEFLCMLAWNGVQLRSVLEKYVDRIQCPDFSIFDENADSVFQNGRQVCVVTMTGDAC